MKKNKPITIFIFSALISFLFSFLFLIFNSININNDITANVNQSRVSSYVPLEQIPLLTSDNGRSSGAGAFSGYLQTLYLWGVSIAVILSIIMIILGGIQYMTTDSVSNKTDGREKIKGAVVGLILALSSYLILNTINPQLVSLDITLPTSE